jgi:hypothetical protein
MQTLAELRALVTTRLLDHVHEVVAVAPLCTATAELVYVAATGRVAHKTFWQAAANTTTENRAVATWLRL